MDGIPNTRSVQYTNAMSDVDESDSDGKFFLLIVKMWSLANIHRSDSVSNIETSHQRYAGRPKSLNIAQSLPVSMPVIAINRDALQTDYDEVSVK